MGAQPALWAAITCNEPDPRLHEDMRDAVCRTFPHDCATIAISAQNAVAHLATAMLFGESTWAAVRNRRLDLGTWQQHHQPRERQVDVAVLGD